MAQNRAPIAPPRQSGKQAPVANTPSQPPGTSNITRPTKEHTFQIDLSQVRKTELELMKLLDEFRSGKLSAFSPDALSQMERIRERQEHLAKTHITLDTKQSDDPGRLGTTDNVNVVFEQLAALSDELGSLQESHHSASNRRSAGGGSIPQPAQGQSGKQRRPHNR